MTPTNAAIWYIESHLSTRLTLNTVAEVAKVSPEHLSRAFLAVTGMTVMNYVRARRMTEAGDVLAANDADILTVALCFGYSSHEAFSRAFKDVFGVSPRDYRATHQTLKLRRKEPILMTETPLEALHEPRIETRSEMTILGLQRVYGNGESAAGIPNQWQEFVSYIGHLPNQKSGETYGVCRMLDGGMQYVCGVEVSAETDAPEGLFKLHLEPQTYAVFEHEGHVSTIRQTWTTIFQNWLPSADIDRADAPDFEWYSADFDPVSGNGRIEIWIPVETK